MDTRASQQKFVLRPIWQIILVVFTALSIPLTLFILKDRIDFRSGASPTEQPAEVVISNISDTSATISFETKSQKTRAIVNFGESENDLSSSTFDERKKLDSNAPDEYKLHYHKLLNLKSNTTYYFSIAVGDKNYKDNAYTFKTLSASSLQVPMPLKGSIKAGTLEEGIIYAHLKSGENRSSIISELIPTNGNFTIGISSATDKNGNAFYGSYPEYVIYLFANAADKGKGAAKATKDVQSIDITPDNQFKEYNPVTLETLLGDTADSTPTATISPTPTAQTSPTPTPSPTPIISNSIDDTSKKLVYETHNTEDKELVSPKNIAISNSSTTSFSVSWNTAIATTGSAAYGINEAPKTLTYDKRDPTTQEKRFTHMIDIVDTKLKAGDIVNITILSGDKEYINGNDYFKYKTPSLEQAPSPQTLEGKFVPEFTASTDKRDFIILLRTSESSWISAVSNTAKNFTLPIGTLLNKTLDENIALSEGTSLEVKIFGENNTKKETTYTYKTDTIAQFEIPYGLTLENIEDEEEIPAGGKIGGMTKPSQTVKIKLDNNSPDSVIADEDGEWTYTIPEDTTEGEKDIVITTENAEIFSKISVQLSQLPQTNPSPTKTATPIPTATSALARTSIDPQYLDYLIGVTLLLIGYYMLKLSSKKETGTF